MARQRPRGPARRKRRRSAPSAPRPLVEYGHPVNPPESRTRPELPEARPRGNPASLASATLATILQRGTLNLESRTIFAAAALLAFGALLEFLATSRELSFHVALPTALVLVIGPGSLGALLGVWLPRLTLRWRLGRKLDTIRPAPAPADLRLAEVLAGAALLIVAFACLLLSGAVGGLEGLRTWLAAHFLLPPAVLEALLLLPTLLGVTAVGLLGAVALATLHGWLRWAAPLAMPIVPLWAAILGATATAAAVQAFAPPIGALLIAAPLAVFGGGLLSVLGSAAPRRLPSAADEAPAEPEPFPFGVGLRPTLARGMVAGALIGGAFVAAVGEGRAGVAALLAQVPLTLSLAALLGLAAGRIALRLAFSANGAIVTLLAAALTLLVSTPAEGVVRLGLTAIVTALCTLSLVLLARRAARLLGRAQRALTWLASAVLAGFAVMALILVAGSALRGEGLAIGVLAALAALVASVDLGFARSLPPPVRVAGPVVAALLLLVFGWSGGGVLPPAAAPERPARPTIRALRQEAYDYLSAMTRQLVVLAPLRDATAARQVDLRGPTCDAVLLTGLDDASPAAIATLQRIAPRALAALRPGGRLILEGKAEALEQLARVDALYARREESCLIEVARGDERVAALAIGPDVAAWLARRPAPADCRVTLTPLVARRPARP